VSREHGYGIYDEDAMLTVQWLTRRRDTDRDKETSGKVAKEGFIKVFAYLRNVLEDLRDKKRRLLTGLYTCQKAVPEVWGLQTDAIATKPPNRALRSQDAEAGPMLTSAAGGFISFRAEAVLLDGEIREKEHMGTEWKAEQDRAVFFRP